MPKYPPTTKARILLVEDDAPQRKTLSGFLSKRNYEVLEANGAASALEKVGDLHLDILLTDLRLGGKDGVDLLVSLRERHPDIQAIVLTAYGTVNDAVRAMRAGAYDFVNKPVDLDHLEALLEKALEKGRLATENRQLTEIVKNTGAFSGFVGQCASIQKIIALAAKVAPSKSSILIQGESGTGKEVLARSIHLASPRNGHPFIAVNCAALPELLIESELFGHVAGAFTGATYDKKGRFELAHGGTLFLDEVGEIPTHLQVKLLSVLQSGQFERVGGTKTLNADVRIIAATNRDVEQQVKEGQLRDDLYYRLNVVSIQLPPLRERKDDVEILSRHFLKKHADLSGSRVGSISPDVFELLKSYPFPGNVRELENWIERAVVLADGEVLKKEDFPEQLSLFHGSKDLKSTPDSGLEAQVASLEISLIKNALRENNGNQSAAARDLNITERSIRYKMKKYGL